MPLENDERSLKVNYCYWEGTEDLTAVIPPEITSLGYADVENRVICKPETIMRIASISKCLTMMAVAKLWEEGKLDLDAPVQKYVPEFPEKIYEGEKVVITTRLLVSHLSGIRHYEKDITKVKEEKEKANRAFKLTKPNQEKELKEKEAKGIEKTNSVKAKKEHEDEVKSRNSKPGRRDKEFEQEEYYLKEKFESVIESLKIFKNDPLFFKPGSQFLYSTYGFTLLSAVVERVSGQKFTDYMLKMFRDLDMLSTVLDDNEAMIYNRARCYVYNKKGRLVNAPYVDNSYKWAGGGFLSSNAGQTAVMHPNSHNTALPLPTCFPDMKSGSGLSPLNTRTHLSGETGNLLWYSTAVDKVWQL
ncbi:serine beta-lactamase-like protein LACTB, mitochondrial isoform X4 [Apteryx rowi]|uniref:serine beta-lactamase-like protein LACTB, mitochondrial isoform X4 n=1 Tax=Apteryx rowi TaxID=308060 RepID=UPI000E1E27E6|nr:serine beta-lactamase-like protein LACTB, mitochondrial isoform X4 [Apteryx rowi]